MTESTVGLSGEGVLGTDVPCRKCSYNLRGLSVEGRCPECGTPVGLSVQGDFLRYSDPRWLDTLRRGASMIIWGVAVIVLGGIAAAVAAMYVGQIGLTIVVGAGSLLMLIGWWLLTSPDPSGIGEDRYGTARKIIRVSLVVGLVTHPLGWLEEMLPPEMGVIVQVLTFLSGVIGAVGIIAEMQYLRKLALRIPDDKLSGRAHFLAYALGISYGLFIGSAAVIGLIFRATGGTAGLAGAFGCFAGILGLALLVFVIMYLLTIEKMGKRFKEQAVYARQTWAAGAAAD